MPVLALLLKVALGNLYALGVAMASQRIAVRLAAAGVIAAAYVGCVVAFTMFIQPLLSALFSTSYGQVLGLAFPPIAGTIVAGIVGLWGCIVVKNHVKRFLKMATG